MKRFMGKTALSATDLPGGNGERILLVDDDPQVARVGRILLTKFGYTVTEMTAAEDALALFTANPSSFDLVLTDMTMPQINGLELIRRMRALRPDIPVVLCSGYSDKITAQSLKQGGINSMIAKPFTRFEIAQQVRRVLDDPKTAVAVPPVWSRSY